MKIEQNEWLPVGTKVHIRQDSKYYGEGHANPDSSVTGIVVRSPRDWDKAKYDRTHIFGHDYGVIWEDDTRNCYRHQDLTPVSMPNWERLEAMNEGN